MSGDLHSQIKHTDIIHYLDLKRIGFVISLDRLYKNRVMKIPQYMILDNNEINSNVTVGFLEYFGDCVCQVFTSPSQLLDALKQTTPDKIFCNVTAKGCDSRELFSGKSFDLPLIFLSSLEKSDERRHHYRDSNHPYLTYPISLEKLIKHINL